MSKLDLKDTVILHCIERGKPIPSISPFVLKLETYLRMVDIPYQVKIYVFIYISNATCIMQV